MIDDGTRDQEIEVHGLDTRRCVYFYEAEFYCLSNFSAFEVTLAGRNWKTAEAAYQAAKFTHHPHIQDEIARARSAHDAFKIARRYDLLVRSDWQAQARGARSAMETTRVVAMAEILREKAKQHEYVRRKLLQTGQRLIVENSWRDAFWGWGPDRGGDNMLGRLWMAIRSEVRHQLGMAGPPRPLPVAISAWPPPAWPPPRHSAQEDGPLWPADGEPCDERSGEIDTTETELRRLRASSRTVEL